MLTFFLPLRWCRQSIGLGLALLLLVPFTWAAPDIKVEGGGDALRENVRNFLSIGEEPCDTALWRLRARMRELESQVQSAAQALGYYHLESQRELSRDDECWSLTITLHPGEPVHVTEMDFRVEGEGGEDGTFGSILEEPNLEKGDVLHHGHYESLKSRFNVVASANGYFEGQFERAQVTVDKEEYSARVELVYNTGPRYHFGDINLKHNVLKESFVRRYLTFEPGEPYDTDPLLELKSRLNSANYFRSVRVTPKLQELEGQRVPVDIELEGRKRHAYSAGVGYATDTGARLLLGYENRYLNRSGHWFNADLQISEVGTNVEASYNIPMTRPAHETLRFYSGYQREETDNTDSDVTTLGTSYTRSEEDSDWLQTYSLNFEREYYEVGGDPEKRSDLLIPAFSLSRTRSDGSNYPTSGWSFLGRISGSPSSLGSDTSFVQLYGRIKGIYGIGPGRVLLRMEGGITEVGELGDLPVSQRFFAGGDASVRGYDYKSIGPTDINPQTGDPIVVGGRNLITQSVEYDYRFKSNWAVAAFFDQGNAFDHSDVDMMRSAGVGFRWISPIGPVRVDFARALDGHEGWRLHLSMGPDL